MRIFWYVFLIVLVVLGVSFAYLNSAVVSFNYYLGQNNLPLSLLLVFALGAGVLLGLIFMLFTWLRLKGRILKLNKRLKFAEQEIENMRSMPIKDSH